MQSKRYVKSYNLQTELLAWRFWPLNLFLCKVLDLKEDSALIRQLQSEIKGQEQLVDSEDHQVQNIYLQRSSQTSLNWSTQEYPIFFSVIYIIILMLKSKFSFNISICQFWKTEFKRKLEMWTFSLKSPLAFGLVGFFFLQSLRS